jgi:micrococcal nuclease
VVRVIDGDTVELADGRTVRYIGIDTPETVAPGQPVGHYGPEASSFNKQLVEGRDVELEKDVSETDRFGRLLRHVYIDGRLVSEILVQQGFAQVSTFPPDVKHQDRLLIAQRVARNAGRGLWANAPVPPTAVPTTQAPVIQPTSPAGPSNCSPSYPTVCIPPAPPDLDCPQISFRRFQVLQPDPHGFDADRDGIGCETG